MKVAIFGTGYVGLVTGACLAEVGHDVLCVDVDADQDRGAEGGRGPDLRARPRGAGGEQPRRGAADVHHRRRERRGARPGLIFIAVGTPPDEDGSADLQIRARGRRAPSAAHMDELQGRRRPSRRCRSAPPTRCAPTIAETLRPRAASDLDFDVVSNPEFLKEGAAVDDFMRPDRIVIGTDDPRARASCCASSTRRSTATTTSSS